MYYQRRLLSLMIIIIYVLPFISSASNDQSYDDCAPVKSFCGLQQRIAYPFWEPSVLQDYCGHPSFKLKCEKNTTLTIDIQDQKYKILEIDYYAQVFTISKTQFLNSTCPNSKGLLTNTTLDFNLFNFSSKSQNATLFYDCLSQKQLGGENPPYAFTCSSIDPYLGSHSIFKNPLSYMAINTTWEAVLRKYCSFEVYTPILGTSATELVNGESTIQDVLTKGFEVKWKIEEDGQCAECTNSKGRCGYNLNDKKPTCFCKDGSYDRACGVVSNDTNAPPNGREILHRTIRVSLGIGIAVFLLSSTLCFFLYWRYRKKDSSTKFLNHYKSYSPSTRGSNFPVLNGSTYFGVHVFNYRELEEATDYFSPSKELGEGGFGTVYHGKLRDGREVAIKRLYENNSRRAEQFLNEVEILANLRHKNLVNLYGCTACQSRELLLVYEYVPNGTVADHLHGKKSKLGLLPWSTRLNIATETASALVYLHGSDIIHRDVKTQNILLGNDFSVKVADFGLSRLFPLDVTHVSTAPQGTPGYVDPEYYQCYQLTEKSDVYSFGVMLAELISSLPAVDITRKRNEINLSNMVINKMQDGELHEFVDHSLEFESDFMAKQEITAVAELAFQCLQRTKEMRPSMNDVLKRLLVIQHEQGSEVDSAEVLDIPDDDVLMLKGDFSPTSPQREDYLGIRYYKANASV